MPVSEKVEFQPTRKQGKHETNVPIAWEKEKSEHDIRQDGPSSDENAGNRAKAVQDSD
jgi:hypothetical protein